MILDGRGDISVMVSFILLIFSSVRSAHPLLYVLVFPISLRIHVHYILRSFDEI